MMIVVRSEKFLDSVLAGNKIDIGRALEWTQTEQGARFWEQVYSTPMTPTAYYELLKIKKSYTKSKDVAK
jgi:hypothetical protein